MKSERRSRPYRLGKRADHQAATRNRILSAARDLLLDENGAQASLDAVAARAGVGRPTVYRHFGSRMALLRALISHVSAEAGLAPAVRDALRLDDPSSMTAAFVAASCGFWDQEAALIRRVLTLMSDVEIAEVVKAADASRFRDATQVARKVTRPDAMNARDLARGLAMLTSPQAFFFLVDQLDMTSKQAGRLLGRMALALFDGGK